METFLSNLGLVNCLKHLSKINVKTVDALKKQSTHQIKALGFKPEVLCRLRNALRGNIGDCQADLGQLRFVTYDEEEQEKDVVIRSLSNTKKKKKKVERLLLNLNVNGEDNAAIDEQQVMTNLDRKNKH